jgi:hypothetical protein
LLRRGGRVTPGFPGIGLPSEGCARLPSPLSGLGGSDQSSYAVHRDCSSWSADGPGVGFAGLQGYSCRRGPSGGNVPSRGAHRHRAYRRSLSGPAGALRMTSRRRVASHPPSPRAPRRLPAGRAPTLTRGDPSWMGGGSR